MFEPNIINSDPRTLHDADAREIYKALREQANTGDVEYDYACERHIPQDIEVDYGVWHITALRHYGDHAEQGGDIGEIIGVTDEDYIEIVDVYDVNEERECPDIMAALNAYCEIRDKIAA